MFSAFACNQLNQIQKSYRVLFCCIIMEYSEANSGLMIVQKSASSLCPNWMAYFRRLCYGSHCFWILLGPTPIWQLVSILYKNWSLNILETFMCGFPSTRMLSQFFLIYIILGAHFSLNIRDSKEKEQPQWPFDLYERRLSCSVLTWIFLFSHFVDSITYVIITQYDGFHCPCELFHSFKELVGPWYFL